MRSYGVLAVILCLSVSLCMFQLWFIPGAFSRFDGLAKRGRRVALGGG